MRLWEEYVEGRLEVEIPAQVMHHVELVLDSNDRLVERKRLPGENDVSSPGSANSFARAARLPANIDVSFFVHTILNSQTISLVFGFQVRLNLST